MPILGSLLAALFEDAVPTLAINPTVTISSSSDQATDPITGAQQSNSVQTMISVDSRQVQEASASNSSLVEFDNTPNHGSGLSLFDPVLSLFDPGELPSNWLKSILSNQNQSVELPLTTYPITGAQQSNSVQTMISVDSQQVLEASASNSSLVVFDDSAPLNSIPFDDTLRRGPVVMEPDPVAQELFSTWYESHRSELDSFFSNQNQSVELPLTTDPITGAQQSNSVQTMISVDSQQVLEASASNSSLVVFDDSAPLNSIPFDDAPHHGSGVGLGLLFDPVLILFDPGELPSNWLESIFSNQNQSVELPLTTDPFAGV